MMTDKKNPKGCETNFDPKGKKIAQVVAYIFCLGTLPTTFQIPVCGVDSIRFHQKFIKNLGIESQISLVLQLDTRAVILARCLPSSACCLSGH